MHSVWGDVGMASPPAQPKNLKLSDSLASALNSLKSITVGSEERKLELGGDNSV